jgi:CPA2 family monovalent cation:H+ antiporter-2
LLLIGHNFLEDLAIVLCVGAFATVVFQMLRLPLVVGYLVAGMVVGPHLGIPLYANQTRIHVISELGVALLIFSIGLEFDLRRLLRLAPTCGLVTIVQVAIMLTAGYAMGRLLGWTVIESMFAGAIISISSTTIVAKVFAERKVEARLRELCFGILLVEDLVAILLLAMLTVVARDKVLSLTVLAGVSGRLFLFLAALLMGGLITVPYVVRAVSRLNRAETMTVASVGICFLFALLAERFGYSVALGAFLAGSLVAQSGKGAEVEHAIAPVRDLFGALFFVSVGMLIDPPVLLQFWPGLIVMTLVVVVGKIVGVTSGALLIGESPRVAVEAGFALAQIGEFAFIMADVGLQAKVTRDFLYSMAVAVSATTAFLTPFLISASTPAADLLRHHTPGLVHRVIRRYVSWAGGSHKDAFVKADSAQDDPSPAAGGVKH